MKGNFGLVWDGTLIDKCDGINGEYLKYNNPHKTSLYLVAGFPVIVWKKSAMAKFVVTNHLGFAIDSLDEIPGKLSAINDKEYQLMVINAMNISKKLRKGYYLNRVLDNISNKGEN